MPPKSPGSPNRREVGERSGQPIDLIDDDDVDPSGLHIDEQFLPHGNKRPVEAPHRSARPALRGRGRVGPEEPLRRLAIGS